MDLDAMKRADTRVDVQRATAERWSPRSFADRPIGNEDLLACLEAARWAPSSFNEQPWRYLVTVAGTEPYDKLFDCLVEWNQQWVKGAPVLILSMARMYYAQTRTPNRHAYHDTGLATMSLVLEAQSRGIYSHQMGGYDDEKARAAFAIPEGVDTVAALALGYRDDPSRLPSDEFREMEVSPRTRRPLAETFYGAAWGEPTSIDL